MNTHTEPIRGAVRPRIVKEYTDEYGTRLYRCIAGNLYYADQFDEVWNAKYTPPVKSKRYKGKNPHTMNELIHA